MPYDYDVLVIGSGFGGSVTALRLTEKGYRVGVLETGRRFTDEQFARSSWRLRDYLWAPALGCHGILRLTLLRDVMIMSGVGVGGGSLGYACTLYEPPDTFYADPQWAHVTDWKTELAPYYDQAKRMLGVTVNPVATAADHALRAVAEDLGVGHTFRHTPVGVLFGDSPGAPAKDPFFGGAGPDRRTCTLCGSCMTGCRGDAKNTLVKNYLYLAEKAGAVVHERTTVKAVRPLPDGGYAADTRGRVFTADQVVFSGGALGTQRLLHRMRDAGHLPHLSPRLGELSRTNSESILGARTRRRDRDYTRGVAITSSIHPDPVTHVEPVRYGPGSNLMALLATVLVDDGRPRWWQAVKTLVRAGRDLRLYLSPRNWSKETIVLLAMQPLDNSITVHTRRGLFGRRITSRPGIGEPNPVWVPAAHDVARRVAAQIDGVATGSCTEIVNRPVTGHFIGGCAIGSAPELGVVDPYHRLFGHPGLHVIDGSVIAANLGVNPSLTITALAERAVALWPNKGDADPRPASGYRSVPPVAPRHPVVPAGAPAALRLTIGKRP